jgi:hypothetical protein
MARRKAKRKTRRRKTGISVLGVAETYMLANVATQTFFNTNPFTFVTGDTPGTMNARGITSISMMELFKPKQGALPTTKVLGKNLNDNWMKGVAGMILVPLAFRVGKQIAAPAISRTNRLLGKVGIAKTVKV